MKFQILITLIIVILFIGCFSSRSSISDFKDSFYVCNKGEMVGLSTVLFEDSTFIYTDRSGIIRSEGKWKISSDNKYITLKSTITPTITKDGIVYIPFNRTLKIKKRKLIDDNDGCIFYQSEVGTNAPQ